MTVRVRSRAEILATLDDQGAVDGLPFMPEMLRFCDSEVEISARADKTCDTIEMKGATRRMDSTVHLTDTRCDGSAHGGCQAGCLLFWKQEWLRPVGPATTGTPVPGPDRPAVTTPAVTTPAVTTSAVIASAEALSARTVSGHVDGKTAYRCQATELVRASDYLSPFDVRQYAADVRSGNVAVRRVVTGLLIELFNVFQRIARVVLPARLRVRDGLDYPFYRGTGPGDPIPPLGLQPGELVEVKSRDEIMTTLSDKNLNRGMWFDSEMLPFCGRQARVRTRVTRIINEKTGLMMRLKDCVILDEVVCLGLYHRFCQRAIFPYWREAWLRRVGPAVVAPDALPTQSAAHDDGPVPDNGATSNDGAAPAVVR